MFYHTIIRDNPTKYRKHFNYQCCGKALSKRDLKHSSRIWQYQYFPPVIQGETHVIKPASFQVAIRFCLGKMILKIALTAVYLLLVEILPEPF